MDKNNSEYGDQMHHVKKEKEAIQHLRIQRKEGRPLFAAWRKRLNNASIAHVSPSWKKLWTL